MRRREFILLAGGMAAGLPVAARAQQGERVRNIAMLLPGVEGNPMWRSSFLERLQELGWMEGRNIRIERRWAQGDTGRMRAFAKEFVTLQPDLIVSGNTPITAALLRETRTIPIVFTSVADPVGSGFVESLARPGGNVTGFATLEPSLGGKWVELLKEIAPKVTRIGIIFNPETAVRQGLLYSQPIKAAAASFQMEDIAIAVHSATEIESALATFARNPESGLIVIPDNFTQVHRQLITSLALRHRLPAVYAYRPMATIGGLVSYGVDNANLVRQAAGYVDRILRGEKPGELPVQQPTKFELAINLKTAKALGFTVPAALLARADEVIE